MERYTYKTFEFLVETPGARISKKFDLDKMIVTVNGLLMTTDKEDLLIHRGSQRIEVSGDEIYPEDHPSRLLFCEESVAADDRYVTIGNGVEAGNGEVKILYKDRDNSNNPFQPYYVSLSLKCLLKK